MNPSRTVIAEIAPCFFLILVGPLLLAQRTYGDGEVDDITPPSITILSPTNNQVFPILYPSSLTNVLISGSVSDQSGVSEVQVVGGVLGTQGLSLDCDTNGFCNFHAYCDLDTGYTNVRVIAVDGSMNHNSATQRVHVLFLPPPPGSFFTGTPTSGEAPLTVTFTHALEYGPITNRVADFGDGTIISYASSNSWVVYNHTYTSAGHFTCSLTAFGPGGSSTLVRSNYIWVTGPPPVPVIDSLSVSNALDCVGAVHVVAAGETLGFGVTAHDPGGSSLSYQWDFGDGSTSGWSQLCQATHAYSVSAGCGAYSASVTVSNGQAITSRSIPASIACQLNVNSLQARLNFARPNGDQISFKGFVDLGKSFSAANKSVTLDVGGAQLGFTLDGKGRGLTARGVCRFRFDKKSGMWRVDAKFNRGPWQTTWLGYNLVNATISRPGVLVTLPVTLIVDYEAFRIEKSLQYTATANKVGLAK